MTSSWSFILQLLHAGRMIATFCRNTSFPDTIVKTSIFGMMVYKACSLEMYMQ